MVGTYGISRCVAALFAESPLHTHFRFDRDVVSSGMLTCCQSVTLDGYPAPTVQDIDWLGDRPDVTSRIQHLYILHSIWTAYSPFIQNARNLRRLTIREDRIKLNFALALTELPNLYWLHIDECEINAEFDEYLQNFEPGQIPAAPALRHVQLTMPRNATYSVDFVSWGMLTIGGTSLQRLDIGTSRFVPPERDEWDHYVRPIRALQHLELETLEREHMARLVEFLQVGAPLSLTKFYIRDSSLTMDDLQSLIDQLSRISPHLSVVEVDV